MTEDTPGPRFQVDGHRLLGVEDGERQIAEAVVGTNCTDNQPSGTGVVTFTNPPLSDIQVRFRDGGWGETSAEIESQPSQGLEPGVYDCTIDIDP